MVIGSRPKLKKIAEAKVDDPTFSIGSFEMDIVENMKYTGFYFDCNFGGNNYMKVLRGKISHAKALQIVSKIYHQREEMDVNLHQIRMVANNIKGEQRVKERR